MVSKVAHFSELRLVTLSLDLDMLLLLLHRKPESRLLPSHWLQNGENTE